MEYMQKMVDNQDGIRNERMKKINCKGIDSSNKNDYIKEKIFSVFDVLPHFKIEKESNGNYKQSSEINKMSRMIANIVASEYEENIKLGDKNIYEDMFIVLDDVFGATNDICEYISEEDDKQRALINAAMTGSNSGTAPGDAPWLMQHVISFYQLFFRPEVQGND